MADVSKITVRIGADTYELEKGLGRAKKETKRYGDELKKLTSLAAGAFSIGVITNYSKEAVKLAGEFEGVSRKFKALGVDINDLNKSVRGTVSELDLMKSVNVAEALGIDVREMATLFEFATMRATETGESVDYLVESIVKGIGRKSPLILDNLGISAIQLREAMGGVSLEAASVADVTKAVGIIAKQSMSAAGDQAVTAGQKMQALAADFENTKVKVGELLISLGDDAGLLDVLNDLSSTSENLVTLFNNLENRFSSLSGNAQEYGDNIKYILSPLLALFKYNKWVIEKLKDLEDAGFGANRVMNETGTTVSTLEDVLSSATPTMDEFWKSFFGGDNKGETNPNIKEIEALQNALSRMDFNEQWGELFSFDLGNASQFREEIESIPKLLEEIEAPNVKFTEGLERSYELAGEIGNALKQAGESGADSMKDFATLSVKLIKRVIAATISEGIANAVANALKSVPFPLNIAAGAAAGGLAAGLFNSLVPSFATGGIVTQPTLAMVGDNPGRKEAIIPSEMFGKLGGSPVVMDVKIKGEDIYLTQRDYNRNRGRY